MASSDRPSGVGAGAIKERDFRQQVVDYARHRGWRVYFTWRSIHSPPGFPDLCLARPPRLVFAELKVGKGRLTEEQAAWIIALRECGQTALVWRPDQSWPEIEQLLGATDAD